MGQSSESDDSGDDIGYPELRSGVLSCKQGTASRSQGREADDSRDDMISPEFFLDMDWRS